MSSKYFSAPNLCYVYRFLAEHTCLNGSPAIFIPYWAIRAQWFVVTPIFFSAFSKLSPPKITFFFAFHVFENLNSFVRPAHFRSFVVFSGYFKSRNSSFFYSNSLVWSFPPQETFFAEKLVSSDSQQEDIFLPFSNVKHFQVCSGRSLCCRLKEIGIVRAGKMIGLCVLRRRAWINIRCDDAGESHTAREIRACEELRQLRVHLDVLRACACLFL